MVRGADPRVIQHCFVFERATSGRNIERAARNAARLCDWRASHLAHSMMQKAPSSKEMSKAIAR
jgi:hypothetical protein